jgi:hypothetical protein
MIALKITIAEAQNGKSMDSARPVDRAVRMRTKDWLVKATRNGSRVSLQTVRKYGL